MTPKEKAEHLVVTMYNTMVDTIEFGKHIAARKCALIAVDEILSFIEDDRESFSWKTYYQEVKQEIEAL